MFYTEHICCIVYNIYSWYTTYMFSIQHICSVYDIYVQYTMYTEHIRMLYTENICRILNLYAV